MGSCRFVAIERQFLETIVLGMDAGDDCAITQCISCPWMVRLKMVTMGNFMFMCILPELK